MPEFIEGKVVHYSLEVLWVLGYEAGDVEISVDSVTQGEIVCFGQDLDTMRKRALSTHALLECSSCRSPTVYLPIEKGYHYQL